MRVQRSSTGACHAIRLGNTAADNPAATPFLPPEEAFSSDFTMLLSEAAPPNLIHNLMAEARPEEL